MITSWKPKQIGKIQTASVKTQAKNGKGSWIFADLCFGATIVGRARERALLLSRLNETLFFCPENLVLPTVRNRKKNVETTLLLKRQRLILSDPQIAVSVWGGSCRLYQDLYYRGPRAEILLQVVVRCLCFWLWDYWVQNTRPRALLHIFYSVMELKGLLTAVY